MKGKKVKQVFLHLCIRDKWIHFFFLLLSVFLNFSSHATEVDSLKKILSSKLPDTARVDALNALSKCMFTSNPDSAITLADQAVELAERKKYNKGLALAYKNVGRGHYLKGEYKEAILNWDKAIEKYKIINDIRGVANMLSNQGAVFYAQGSDDKALELHLASLKLAEEINDTLRIVTSLINVGGVYSNKWTTYKQALEYFLKAYNLSSIINDQSTLGASAVNVGETYHKLGNDNKALEYYFISKKVYEGSEDLPYTLNDIGQIYTIQKRFDEAIKIHKEAYELSKRLETKLDQTQSLLGLGQAYLAKGDFKTSIVTFKQSLDIATELNAPSEKKESYYGLTQAYAKIGDFTAAFRYQNLLLAIKDTIYNLDIDKKVGKMTFKLDLEKKDKDIKLKDESLKRQKLVKSIFIGGFIVMVLFASVFFTQRNKIGKEKKRSEALLLNILPEETAEELKATGKAKTKSFELVSVLFTDFKNFTQASEILTPEELVEEINHCYSAFDAIISDHNLEKIKTIGDSYMCAGGLPVPNKTNPFDVIAAGLKMVEFIEKNKQERIAKGKPYFELRLGIHSGPVVAGIVGIKKFAYDIWGDTVNTASRMESSGAVGKVNISGTTYEIVKNTFHCSYRGKIEAKNKGVIDMYFVDGFK